MNKSNQYDDWLFFIAIGLSIVAVGAVIDFFLKKSEVRKLHNKFLNWANALSETPLHKWQITIAYIGVRFIEFLKSETMIIIEYIGFVEDRIEKIPIVIIKNVFLFLWISIHAVFLTVGIIILYIYTDYWVFGTICLPFIGMTFLALWLSLEDFGYIPKMSSDIENYLTSVPTISAFLSLIASAISVYFIPESFLNTYWYKIDGNSLSPTFPLLLTVVNFPFDFITIFVSVYLLKYVTKYGKFIGLIALIDVIASAFLTVLLHTTLLVIQNDWDILHIYQYLLESTTWFLEVIIVIIEFWGNKQLSLALKSYPDLHLLPILMTTFIPVALYMTVFLFLSFSKPIMWLTARFFAVIGERDDSVFKQFGILIASLGAAFKAVYDYLVSN